MSSKFDNKYLIKSSSTSMFTIANHVCLTIVHFLIVITIIIIDTSLSRMGDTHTKVFDFTGATIVWIINNE